MSTPRLYGWTTRELIGHICCFEPWNLGHTKTQLHPESEPGMLRIVQAKNKCCIWAAASWPRRATSSYRQTNRRAGTSDPQQPNQRTSPVIQNIKLSGKLRALAHYSIALKTCFLPQKFIRYVTRNGSGWEETSFFTLHPPVVSYGISSRFDLQPIYETAITQS